MSMNISYDVNSSGCHCSVFIVHCSFCTIHSSSGPFMPLFTGLITNLDTRGNSSLRETLETLNKVNDYCPVSMQGLGHQLISLRSLSNL